MAQGRAALEDALPPSACKELGLDLIGEAVGQGWTDAEANSFEDIFWEFRQNFDVTRKCFLPLWEPVHLSRFFLNVWKSHIHPELKPGMPGNR